MTINRRIPPLLMTALAVAFATANFSMPSPSIAQVFRDNGSDDARDARAAERRAAVQAARADVERARAQVQAAQARVRANWAANADMTAAEQELAAARADFEAARQPVVERLMQTDPQYAQAMREEREAAERVRAAQAANPASTQPTTAPVDLGIPDDGIGLDEDQGDANVDPATTQPIATPEQMRAAQARLDQKTRLRKLEDDAIAADPTAAAARAKLHAVGEKRKALQAQLQAALLNDPEYKQAKAELDAARARVTAAAAGR